MSRGVIVLPILKELEELLGTSLLKKSHKRALDCLHFGTRNLGNLSLAENKTTCNLLELKVGSYVGMHKNLRKLPRCDDELWNQINSVVTIPSKIGGLRLSGSEFLE